MICNYQGRGAVLGEWCYRAIVKRIIRRRLAILGHIRTYQIKHNKSYGCQLSSELQQTQPIKMWLRLHLGRGFCGNIIKINNLCQSKVLYLDVK